LGDALIGFRQSNSSGNLTGAVGDGVADDTAAIEAAFAYSFLTATQPVGVQMGWAYNQQAVFFPFGTYIYSGAGVNVPTTKNLIVLSDPNTATIKITSDVNLFTVSGLALNTYCSGLHILGGRGFCQYTNTSGNVAGMYVFEDIKFDAYTVCAVSNESNDQPYFKFLRCMFMGVATGETIGVAIGGYIDGAEFSNCAFLRNKYHLKIGPRISGNVLVDHCDFIAWTPGLREADIWFVPNAEGPSAAGVGTVVCNSKFGPENASTDKPRLLFANESTTGSRGSKHHVTTDGGFINGITFSNNLFFTNGPLTTAMAKSFVTKVANIIFATNQYKGGDYTYLCEFVNIFTDSDSDWDYRTWNIDVDVTAIGAPFAAISNTPIGIAQTATGSLQTDKAMLLTHNSVGDDASFKNLANYPSGFNLVVTGGTVKTAVNDIYGTNRAANVELALPSLAVNANAPLVSPVVGAITWVEIDLKKSATKSLDYVYVCIRNPATTGQSLYRKVYLQNDWATVRIPSIFPPSTNLATWQAFVCAGANLAANPDFLVGTKDSFVVGRFHVYQAKQPINIGHLQSVGTGLWNGEHIVMGAFNLWVDASGRLRIKNGDPTSDTDGVIVGTQS
jgi:hypothetical protein